MTARKTGQTPKKPCGAYVIEKGIAMTTTRTQRPCKFPVREMKVMDSFLIPENDVRRTVTQCVRKAAGYYGFKVSTRKVEGGVRVWRVA
jgi:hypothetical protein